MTWRDETGLIEMLLSYLNECQSFAGWASWRRTLVDILACHEEARQRADTKFPVSEGAEEARREWHGDGSLGETRPQAAGEAAPKWREVVERHLRPIGRVDDDTDVKCELGEPGAEEASAAPQLLWSPLEAKAESRFASEEADLKYELPEEVGPECGGALQAGAAGVCGEAAPGSDDARAEEDSLSPCGPRGPSPPAARRRTRAAQCAGLGGGCSAEAADRSSVSWGGEQQCRQEPLGAAEDEGTACRAAAGGQEARPGPARRQRWRRGDGELGLLTRGDPPGARPAERRGGAAEAAEAAGGEAPREEGLPATLARRCFVRAQRCDGPASRQGAGKAHQCCYCRKQFVTQFERVRHERVHTGEKPFKCCFCPKAFSTRDNQSAHLRTHTGERPYKCTFCWKSFSDRRTRFAHHRMHAGVRRHKCASCGKAFVRRVDMLAHEASHTGEKPYKCSFCPNAFSRREHLTGHERTHTGEKPHKCCVCEKVFAHHRSRVRHQQLVHGWKKPSWSQDLRT